MNNIPTFEKIEAAKGNSFEIGIYKQSYFKRTWHYHPETELLHVIHGHGKRFVGDSEEDFYKDDLVLLGGNLPHAWISDPVYYQPGTKKSCKSVYLQFNFELLGDSFLQIPEMTGIKEMLKHAKRGIRINGNNKETIIKLMKELPKREGMSRFVDLLTMLELIRKSDYTFLSSEAYASNRNYLKHGRVNRVHEYLMDHFKQNISLRKAAGIACMNSSAFARFFKAQTGKTFSAYLAETRVEFAGKLLKGTDLSISSIAYECGFNSIPYFNRKFKTIKGCTPGSFRNDTIVS
jgi:AraC-like DNA-binding protein